MLKLERQPGQGPTILVAPQGSAVAMAQRLFPDRRLEIKTLFAEPDLGPGRRFLDWRLLRWMLRPARGGESAEAARRRVVETAVRLISLAKEHEEATLVAGPVLLRLLAFKLNGIGYGGPFLSGFKAGQRRVYRYRI
ncbi:MAG: hypothetical protein ACREKE_06595 [bacterium]